MSFKSWLHFIISMFIIQSRWNGVLNLGCLLKGLILNFACFYFVMNPFLKDLVLLLYSKDFMKWGMLICT